MGDHAPTAKTSSSASAAPMASVVEPDGCHRAPRFLPASDFVADLLDTPSAASRADRRDATVSDLVAPSRRNSSSQACAPEALAVAQPFVSSAKRAGIQTTDMDTAPHFPSDQTGTLQRPDVLGGRRQRHPEGLGQLADRVLALLGKAAQHAAAREIAQGVEDRIQSGIVKLNHEV